MKITVSRMAVRERRIGGQRDEPYGAKVRLVR